VDRTILRLSYLAMHSTRIDPNLITGKLFPERSYFHFECLRFELLAAAAINFASPRSGPETPQQEQKIGFFTLIS
jgi:hypothetical protein